MEKEKLVTGPYGGLAPGQTSRLTVGRNLTSTSTKELFKIVDDLMKEKCLK
jgi:hypothetical protein